MSIRVDVWLMVVWGDVLRGDLQTRGTARERKSLHEWREGMSCRKIAVNGLKEDYSSMI